MRTILVSKLIKLSFEEMPVTDMGSYSHLRCKIKYLKYYFGIYTNTELTAALIPLIRRKPIEIETNE